MFSQKQVSTFKDGFQIIDRDRDGVLNASDLRAMFDEIGRIMSDEQLDEMLTESEGPMNFTAFLTLFASQMGGESDDDDVIAKAIRAFEKLPGEIDADEFRTMLMAFGDKFTSKEVDEVLACVELDEDTNQIETDSLIAILASAADEE